MPLLAQAQPVAESSASPWASPDTNWVIALGTLAGVSSLSLSLTGLLAHWTPAAIAACLMAAMLASAFWIRRSGRTVPSWVVWVLLPLTAPSALAALLLPPHTWDEVAYGAALPREFARAGRFFYQFDYGPYSAFPGNYEALVSASLLSTGDVRVAQLLNVAFALGIAVMAVAVARRLGARPAAALMAGLLVLCAPAVIAMAPLTKNDVSNAFFQTLAVMTLAELLETRPTLAVTLSGAFMGLALGTKYSSLQFLMALAPFALWLIASSARSWRTQVLRASLWLLAIGLVGGPWYLRNLLLFRTRSSLS